METVERNKAIDEWWSKRKARYNIGLIFAGIIAFILYVILGSTLLAPYDKQFEITLFSIFFQGIGYLIMIVIANLFYQLGPYVDKQNNVRNSEKYRQRLFKLGFWCSFALPFLIPILVIIKYLVDYS